MHDPMVVAFEIRRPWPSRRAEKVREGQPRYQVTIYRKHGNGYVGPKWNPRRWWRPDSWSPFVTAFGRRWYFPSMVTIWHVEPGGHDSGDICKHRVNGKYRSRWKWHVHHWRIQVSFERKLRRWFMARCELCGRRYPWSYAPVSHGWHQPLERWGLRSQRRAYHHECSSLVSLRHVKEGDERLIRHLFNAACVYTDTPEKELLAHLTNPKARGMEFNEAYRLTRLLGWERDENYDLVRTHNDQPAKANQGSQSEREADRG